MTAYDTAVLADTPWFYGKTDEASGLVITDYSGNSRHLNIPAGLPTFAQTGPDGSSADAQRWGDSASGTEFYALSVASPGSGTAWAIECWFYLTAAPAHPTALATIAYGYSNNSRRPLHFYVDTDGKIKLMGGSSGTSGWPAPIASASAIAYNTWHHAVAVTTSTTQKIRLDKSDVASGTNGVSITTSDQFFVHGGGDPSGTTLGPTMTDSSPVVISKPALYLATLTDARIDAHYDAMGVVGTPTPTKLTGVWGLVA